MEPETPPAAGLPPGPQKRAYQAEIADVSKARRTVAAKINTASVDRFRTVILPSGGDFRKFAQTPAVLWEHGDDPTRGRLPIGTCTSIKYRRAEDDILAVTAFKSDDYSQRIFDDFENGTLSSFSVDFLPEPAATSRPTPEEIRSHPEWSSAEVVFRKWELTGYSAVAYPGNPEALALAVSRGLWIPEETRRILAAARAMTEGSGAAGGYVTGADQDEDKGAGERKRYITQEGDEWIVHAEDGKVLGKHKTKEEAEQQLKAVEAHKHDEGRTAPELPANLRTYTAEEFSRAMGRLVFDPMFAIFDRKLRDAEDLARGRV